MPRTQQAVEMGLAGTIVAGVMVTRFAVGGEHYLCPDCGMEGETRELPVDALTDLVDHKDNGECIGPVRRGLV